MTAPVLLALILAIVAIILNSDYRGDRGMKDPSKIKVLVACEESQRVCMAFRERGFTAYSCDIQEPSGGHPEWHIRDDAVKALMMAPWDLLIAHPPCTYLSNAGACRLCKKIDGESYARTERVEKGIAARDFFYGVLQCSNSAYRGRKPRADGHVALAEIHADHTAVLFRGTVHKENVPMAMGVAGT